MIAKFIIFFLMASSSFQNYFPCVHVYEKDYAIFLVRESEDWTKLKSVGGEKNEEMTIYLGCSSFDIPEICQVAGKAWFVFIDGKQQCTIMQNPESVEFMPFVNQDQKGDFKIPLTIVGETIYDEKTIREEKEPPKLTLNIEFTQSLFTKSNFVKNQDIFTIQVVTPSSPLHFMTFLKALKENHVVSTIIFFTFGLILCFFGLKFYREMLTFFIPLMIAVLGFYLYITIVEKSVETNEKLMLILITLFCLAVFIGLAVTFSGIIYVVLSLLASYQLGNFFHKLLEPKVEFFKMNHTEYIVMVAVFVCLIFFYMKMKDYFIIFCTTLVGSALMILGISYSGITDTDFLFSLELGKFKNLKELDQNTQNFLIIYVLVLALGAMVQIFLFKRNEEDSGKNKNLTVELKGC